MTKLIFAMTAGLLATSAAFAQQMPAKNADAAVPVIAVSTPDFAKTVMSSDQFELQSSKMADSKAEAADIKSYAADMIKDHTKSEKDLKAALGSDTATPAAPELAPKHAAMLKQLEAADGKDFEMLYLDMQAQSHMEAVALFRNYAGSGDQEEVVAFAKTTLPTLEEHTMHVMELVAAH